MRQRPTHGMQSSDLLDEIHEAQAVLRAAWQTYPELPEVTGPLALLRTKLENIEQAAQTVNGMVSPAIRSRKRGA